LGSQAVRTQVPFGSPIGPGVDLGVGVGVKVVDVVAADGDSAAAGVQASSSCAAATLTRNVKTGIAIDQIVARRFFLGWCR
jgi:hypothetical protein